MSAPDYHATPITEAALGHFGIDSAVSAEVSKQLEIQLYTAEARAEKAEASLHNVSLDLLTANHMIKLERDRADALQTRLNEIDAMLKSPDLID
jgi:hypothetical protein